MNRKSPAVLDALAQDYASGLLTPRARRRFERLLREQPVAALALAAWQARLAQMSNSLPRLTVSPWLRERLERRLFGAPLASPDTSTATAAPAANPSPRARWRELLGGPWWRSATGMALGGALAMAVMLLQPTLAGLEPARDSLPASYVGVLADAQGQGGLIVSSRRHGRVVHLKLLRPLSALPPQRLARLWAYPANGSAPFLVGSLPAAGKAELQLGATSEQLFAQVTRLAVHADAPGAAVPGALLLSGPCAKLW